MILASVIFTLLHYLEVTAISCYICGMSKKKMKEGGYYGVKHESMYETYPIYGNDFEDSVLYPDQFITDGRLGNGLGLVECNKDTRLAHCMRGSESCLTLTFSNTSQLKPLKGCGNAQMDCAKISRYFIDHPQCELCYSNACNSSNHSYDNKTHILLWITIATIHLIFF